MSNKITYLLGAGASWESIPVVGELEKAFDTIRRWNNEIRQSIPNRQTYSVDEKSLIEASDKFEKQMRIICENTPLYKTIDTYAKKLTINNSNAKLHQLKSALSLFFTVWQGSLIKDVKLDHTIDQRKFKEIDPRYLGLLTNYLKKDNVGQVKLDQNVHFISWNYDTQIERALAIILDESLDNIFSLFRVFPLNNISPQIIHLNGIAGYYNTENKKSISMFREESPIGNRLPVDVLKDLLYVTTSVERMSVFVDEHFTFAWEEEKINKALIEAEKVLSETETLVIIGYSFPNFNNDIDKKLFNSFINKGSQERDLKIYYQDPNANKAILSKRFGIQEEIIEIDKENKSQFILPLERIK